jgi:hypothetical protein
MDESGRGIIVLGCLMYFLAFACVVLIVWIVICHWYPDFWRCAELMVCRRPVCP